MENKLIELNKQKITKTSPTPTCFQSSCRRTNALKLEFALQMLHITANFVARAINLIALKAD